MSEQRPDVFIGIDIGTFEAKGVAVGLDGEVLVTVRRPHRPSTPRPGWLEHDAVEVWWLGTVEICRRLMAHDRVRAGQVVAVGCSGIGPCVLPVDADLIPLRPAILYGVDGRAAAQVARLTDELGSSTILARGGNALSSQSAGPKIAWLRDVEPDIHAATSFFLTCQSYLVARLTGSLVIDHATASYYQPLYALHQQEWDLRGCDAFVRLDQLPRLAWATDRAGTVNRSAAQETGLPEGTPVIVGTADAPAEAFGAGVVAPGDLMVMYGSSSFMLQIVERAAPDAELWAAPYVLEGSWQLAAGTSTAGTTTRWIIEMLGLDAHQGDDAFAELVTLAEESPPGARGLLTLPYFSGERTPLHDPDIRGLLAGLDLVHTRSDLARSAIEGVAHSMARAISSYVRAGHGPSCLTAVGGGTANPVWVQAVSDITGLSQQITMTPGAAFGSAALAAVGTEYLSAHDVTTWQRDRRYAQPDTDNGEVYRARHEQFIAMTSLLREVPGLGPEKMQEACA